MKKLSKNTAIIVMSLVLAFSFTACSVGSNSAEKAVADFVDANKSNVEHIASVDGVMCELEAQSTTVVYKYTYNEKNNFSIEQKEELESALADNETQIMNTLEMMCEEEKNITALVYEFYESDGDLILSRKYY